MATLYPQNWLEYLGIVAVFLRLLGLLLLMPVLSHKTIPAPVKIFISLSLAFALHPIVRPYMDPIPMTPGGITLYVIRETAVGFLMGFASYLTFEAIHLSAQFIGTQMGFGTAGLLDPHSQTQASLLVPLYGWLALLAFLMTDMHHNMFKLFVVSFQATKHVSDSFLTGAPLAALLISMCGKLFVTAVQMAAPFTFLFLGVNVALGVLARLLPQMNVLLFSFPITIMAGLGGMYLLAPEMLASMESMMGDMTGDLMNLLRVL
jgi:flagellar biosynthetic protein FliR